MASVRIGPPDRRGFLQRAGTAMAALLAGVGADSAFGAGRHRQIQTRSKNSTVWIVDFLTVSGRVVKPFAREEDATKYAAKLITHEIEAGQVRQPGTILRRIAANDPDGAIAAYREDQQQRSFGGEVRVFEECVS